MDKKARVSNYYLARKEKYWKQLGRLFRSSNKILPTYFDSKPAGQIGEETKEEFYLLLLDLPDIGGDKNMLTFTLVSSAAALAYMRTLKKYELPVDIIGKIINEVYEDVYRSLPGVLKWFLRWSEFSTANQNKLRAFAAESQLRQYPDNWVLAYIEGQGDDFDFGCNYMECAVLKFYRKMNGEEFMPYICVMDFTMSRALRTGLYRTTTIQYGGNQCDFRYKKNQLGLPALPIEDLPEYKNRRK